MKTHIFNLDENFTSSIWMKLYILNLDENFTSSIRVFLCRVNPREQKHFKDHLLTPHDKQARHIGQGGVFFFRKILL